MKVKDILAREILASNAEKSVEIEIIADGGNVRASSPIGTSTGKHEAVSYPSDAVLKKFALIKRSLRSQDYSNQKEVDDKIKEIDRTNNFRDVGGNLAIAISSAFLKAFARNEGQEIFEYTANEYKIAPKIPLPISIVAGGWRNSDVQEFHFIPMHQDKFSESISSIAQAYKELGKAIEEKDKNFRFGKNLESGWSTGLHFKRVLGMMKEIGEERMLRIGIDMAASHLWDKKDYVYSSGEKLSPSQQVAAVQDVAKTFSVSYIEDPLHEEDFLNFGLITDLLKPKIVCGDDLYATRTSRLIYGAEKKSTNAAIVKPNQVGTISDTVEFVKEAKRNNILTVMSHRSGETDDNLIAHLCVGLGCDYAKMGLAGERIIKINELIRIEERMHGIE